MSVLALHLLSRHFVVEVDDFRVNGSATPDFMRPGNRTGTPIYHAPEISRRRTTDLRVDVFALGITAYQLCTFESPWPVSRIRR